jgi:hypothetical protein
VTKIAYRRDKYLRSYQQRFIEIFQVISAQMGNSHVSPGRAKNKQRKL